MTNCSNNAKQFVNESPHTKYVQINGSGRTERFPLNTPVWCVQTPTRTFDRDLSDDCEGEYDDDYYSDYGPKHAAKEKKQKDFDRYVEHKSKHEPRFQVFNPETGEYEAVPETTINKSAKKVTDPKTLEWVSKQNSPEKRKIMDIINSMTYDEPA